VAGIPARIVAGASRVLVVGPSAEGRVASASCDLQLAGCTALAFRQGGMSLDFSRFRDVIDGQDNTPRFLFRDDGVAEILRCDSSNTCTSKDLTAAFGVRLADARWARSDTGLVVAGGNGRFARTPWLVRCDGDGENCASANLSVPSSVGNSAAELSLAGASFARGVSVVTRDPSAEQRLRYFRCDAEGQQCTTNAMLPSEPPGSGYDANALREEDTGRIVALASEDKNLAMAVCDNSGGACVRRTLDFPAPGVLLPRFMGRLRGISFGDGARLFDCALDGNACVGTPPLDPAVSVLGLVRPLVPGSVSFLALRDRQPELHRCDHTGACLKSSFGEPLGRLNSASGHRAVDLGADRFAVCYEHSRARTGRSARLAVCSATSGVCDEQTFFSDIDVRRSTCSLAYDDKAQALYYLLAAPQERLPDGEPLALRLVLRRCTSNGACEVIHSASAPESSVLGPVELSIDPGQRRLYALFSDASKLRRPALWVLDL
jgi:hypothetical protein